MIKTQNHRSGNHTYYQITTPFRNAVSESIISGNSLFFKKKINDRFRDSHPVIIHLFIWQIRILHGKS